MEIYKMSDKEFRIIPLKKFSEVQEPVDRKLNKMNKMRSSAKRKLSKTKKKNWNPRAEEYNKCTNEFNWEL